MAYKRNYQNISVMHKNNVNGTFLLLVQKIESSISVMHKNNVNGTFLLLVQKIESSIPIITFSVPKQYAIGGNRTANHYIS